MVFYRQGSLMLENNWVNVAVFLWLVVYDNIILCGKSEKADNFTDICRVKTLITRTKVQILCSTMLIKQGYCKGK